MGRLPLLALVAASFACSGNVGNEADDGGASGRDGAVGDSGLDGSTGADGSTMGVDAAVDAGQCRDRSLADRLAITPLAGISGNASAFPLPSGGVLIGQSDGNTITLAAFDGAGSPSGAGIELVGDGLWGLAASNDAFGALVARGDVLALVIVSSAGAPIAETTLMGGVDHAVTNNEWFGSQLRAGRLDWNGTQWIAYATVQRLWPDGIAHYGDTLRAFRPDGGPDGVYWGWGCSHSIDVRLTHNAQGIGAVCSSDCYPEKGVFFMHDTTVFLDASGNCAGFVAQELGGVVPTDDGFIVGFVSGEGRGSKDPALTHVGDDHRVGPIVWLGDDPGDESALHLSRYGTGLLAGFNDGSSGHLLELDVAGALRSGPVPIASDLLANAGDFFVYADGSGDVGWLTSGRLARLSNCR